MAENILILHPRSYDLVPENSTQLIEILRGEHFIGKPVEIAGEQHYRPGEAFMMLITFLGCSPMVFTDDDNEGEQNCHIAFEGPYDRARCLVGDNVKAPRCPKCGHRHNNWPALLDGWQAAPEVEMACPGCGHAMPVPALRWRKCAAFGRFFIKVWGIFESEAVPSPNLLALLQRATGVEWQHAYLRIN